MNEIHVTGVTSFTKDATPRFRLLSAIFDSLCIASLFLLMVFTFNLAPFPSISTAALFLAFSVSYYLVQKKFFGVTLGERVWYIEAKTRDSDRVTQKTVLYQKDHLSFLETLSSVFFTACTCAVFVLQLSTSLRQHPVWRKATVLELNAAIPLEPPSALTSAPSPGTSPVTAPAPTSLVNWIVVPFFYHIGSWPSTFDGKSVFYTLAYEVGPPKKFVGKVSLHLQDPGIQMIIEGPKTPDGMATQKEIKDCLISNSHSLGCTQLRLRALSRHIDELQPSILSYWKSDRWQLEWFQVKNPALAEADQAQGIHLRASGVRNADEIQDRFILINSNGTHQTLVLNRPNSPLGEAAYSTALKTLSSLRSFKELNAGRAWINRALESIHLEKIQELKNPLELTSQLALIQSFLISRISVDPANFETYYHLAGTSLLLTNHPKLKEWRDQTRALPNGPEKLAALQNLNSAYRFAVDVAPRDARIAQIEGMLNDARKALSSDNLGK